MITILVLSGSSFQVVIVYQVENEYAKVGMNQGLKCVLPENIKNRTKVSISGQCLWCHKGRYLEHQILVTFQTIPSTIKFQISESEVVPLGCSKLNK